MGDRSTPRALPAFGDCVAPADFGQPELEYERLVSAAALVPAPWEALLRFEGRDWRSFLHSLLTQDVNGLPRGASAPAALADRKGHLLADLWLAAEADADAGWMRLRRDRLGPVLDVLERHRFSEQVRWSVDETRVCLLLLGPRARDLRAELISGPHDLELDPDRGSLSMAIRETTGGEAALFLPPPAAAELLRAQPSAGFLALERRHLESGVAWYGVEADSARLVPEAGLTDRISYRKGCYLGQETLARLHYLGQLNWALSRFRISVPEGAGLSGKPDLSRPDGERIGWLEAWAPGSGEVAALGYLHRRFREAPGQILAIGAAEVRWLGEAVPPSQE
ncbi:MAG: hypothetical protein IPK72_11280 [Candidatus Eisenbacteria bacterium]|nr:hypothetical protein [Candidatus Eisenbacteria bacterium]